MFERLRAAVSRWLDAASAPTDPSERVSRMRDAVIRARMAVDEARQGIRKTERELAAERQQLDDAERRGRLAEGIKDDETVQVATRFAGKHRERVRVLEQKLEAQRAELGVTEREYAEMKAELAAAVRGDPVAGAQASAARAWEAVAGAGGTRPETDVEGEHLRSDLDRRARERAADEQLQTLKQRMKRE